MNRNNETFVLFAGESMKFEQSIDFCHDQFGSSAMVRNRNDQEFLKEWLKDEAENNATNSDDEESLKTWLGARYFKEGRGRLVWQTLQQTSRQAFAFWAKGEPKCYSSCCGVAIDNYGAWYSIPCDWKAQVLCKMSKSDSERYLKSLQGSVTENFTTTKDSESEPLERAEEEDSTEEVNTQYPMTAVQMNRMKVKLKHLEGELSILRQNVTQVTRLLEEEREERRSEMDNMRAMMMRLQADFGSSLKSLEKMIRTRLP